jgi:IstB-like ATP binding protein
VVFGLAQPRPWSVPASTSGLTLGREVDDFGTPVLGSGRVRFVLQPRLAVADGAQFGCGETGSILVCWPSPASRAAADAINDSREAMATARPLDKALFQQIATCRWIAEHPNPLVTGPCGIGKSCLSCALAQKAGRDGYTVHYARVPRLFADLGLAHGDGRFARLFRTSPRPIC